METDSTQQPAANGLNALVDKALAAASAFRDAQKKQDELVKQLNEANAETKKLALEADAAVGEVWRAAKYPDAVEVNGTSYVRKSLGVSMYQMIVPIIVYKEKNGTDGV